MEDEAANWAILLESLRENKDSSSYVLCAWKKGNSTPTSNSHCSSSGWPRPCKSLCRLKSIASPAGTGPSASSTTKMAFNCWGWK